MATAPGALAPATRSPRNAMFPVMKAEKTLPRARKLIASTAPDEIVKALSNRVANPEFDRWLVDLCYEFGSHDLNQTSLLLVAQIVATRRPQSPVLWAQSFLVAHRFAQPQPPTIGVLAAGIFARTDSSTFRCARTSSCGVNFNHCASDTSA